ncbi:uncharacterized protein LOC142609104 [Castanea sativa]|uniref:uncharacterized protein LOC142609104 n=1 Tax=Castanea sativa TaxID=21020 RepID=UPI003F64CA95
MKYCEKTPKTKQANPSDIQKDIVNAIAYKTTNAIIEDLGGEFFSILVDESRDISIKEQMGIVFCVMWTKKGIVTERFLGIVHVADTSALSLKAAIEFLFCKYSLSLSRLRGQGYDGASNMQGEFNGLKTLILKDNKSEFYVHCFAHQLKLTLVSVSNNHTYISEFFILVSKIVTIVGASCKRREFLLNAQLAKITEALNLGELESGQVDVLEMIEKDSLLSEQRVEARSILSNHDIPILNMEEIFVVGVRPRRNAPQITNLHHYRVDLFFEVIDTQLQELNNRFRGDCELLLCMACLNPSDSFSAFDIQKLTVLQSSIHRFFRERMYWHLIIGFETYIVDMRSNNEFLELKGIGDLARKMVETNKDVIYPLVYLLVKLVLTLLCGCNEWKEVFQQ